MEASPDRNSSNTSISEDYEIISNCETLAQPIIEKCRSNLEDLLSEALKEAAGQKPNSLKKNSSSAELISSDVPDGLDIYKLIEESDTMDTLKLNSNSPESQEQECRLVGAGTKFYNMTETVETHPLQQGDTLGLPKLNSFDEEQKLSTPTEKQDTMKASESDDEHSLADVFQGCTRFHGVSYLGASKINSPRSEQEIQRIMQTLCAQRESMTGILVSISIPTSSEGVVVLYDAATNSVMARYAVKRISYYARGAVNTDVEACFAFTWSHGESKELAVYQCHVFRCHICEAVAQVSNCFVKAFERVPRSMTSSLMGDMSKSMTGSLEGSSLQSTAAPPQLPLQLMHVLECTVEIKEVDHKGSFAPVPKERLGFKIRGGVDKQVNVSVKQVHDKGNLGDDEQELANTGRLIIERCFGILVSPGRNVKHSDMQLLEMVGGATDEHMGYNACALWNAGDPSLAGFNLVGDYGPTHMTIWLDLVIRGVRDPLRLVIETPVKVFPPTEKFWVFSKRPLVQQFFVNFKETTDEQGESHFVVSNVESSGELDRSRLLPLAWANLLPSQIAQAPASPTANAPDSDNDEPLLSGTGEVSRECDIDVLENWSHVLRSWNGSRPKTLNQLVRLGIPESLRCEVWQRLAETDKYQDLIDHYRILITKECECEGVIQRDLARTFPAHDYFKEAGGLGQDSLLRLARAYAVYDTEVGYCQGLSFLAATLLLHMPEEQAFCVLVRLMYGYGLRDLYKDGFEHLYMRLYQLDRLMEEHLPDLRQHFRDTGVEPHMFASQWLLTLYTARFPLPLVFQIVDVFLLQGMDTLFQVAIALLSKARKDLLTLDFEGILKYFRVSLPKRCRAEDVARKIVKNACTIKVKRLPKYQAEFEAYTKETAQKEIDVEMERLKSLNLQLLEEKEQMEAKLETALKETQVAMVDNARSAAIARDYREICAQKDKQLHLMQDIVKDCVSCSKKMSPDNKEEEEKWEKRCEGQLEVALRNRVRDLELELAQVKFEHVQAECNNQELTHQLKTALNDYNTMINQRQAWPPWLAKTLGSIKEAAQHTKPTFQTYIPTLTGQDLPEKCQDGDRSPTSPLEFRRVSAPITDEPRKKEKNDKRHSLTAAKRIDAAEKNVKRKSHDLTSHMKDMSLE